MYFQIPHAVLPTYPLTDNLLNCIGVVLNKCWTFVCLEFLTLPKFILQHPLLLGTHRWECAFAQGCKRREGERAWAEPVVDTRGVASSGADAAPVESGVSPEHPQRSWWVGSFCWAALERGQALFLVARESTSLVLPDSFSAWTSQRRLGFTAENPDRCKAF